jgi:hypothetical protein
MRIILLKQSKKPALAVQRAMQLSGFCSGVSKWLVSSSALRNHACQKNTRQAKK